MAGLAFDIALYSGHTVILPFFDYVLPLKPPGLVQTVCSLGMSFLFSVS